MARRGTLVGIKSIPGFNAFVRDFDPSYLKRWYFMGPNTPIRIGHAIVLPGDLVISEKKVYCLHPRSSFSSRKGL